MVSYVAETRCVVDKEGRASNLQRNLARGFSWAEKGSAREGKLAIVGSGPSVRSRLEVLREWAGEIWAINGAYDWLLSENIVPSGFFGVDPLPGLADYLKDARSETTFYIAGTCDPCVLDALEGRSVCLWFPEAEDRIYPESAMIVNGGTTALTRAPFMAFLMGWRDITLFGADASFEDRRYCYRDGTYEFDSKAEILKVCVEDEVFLTEMALAQQVSQLGVMHDQFRGILKFDCDGLTAAYLRSPMHQIDKDGNVSRADAA